MPFTKFKLLIPQSFFYGIWCEFERSFRSELYLKKRIVYSNFKLWKVEVVILMRSLKLLDWPPVNEIWKCMESGSSSIQLPPSTTRQNVLLLMLTNQVFCCRDPHQSSPNNGQTSVGSLRVVQPSHFSRRPRRSHQ